MTAEQTTTATSATNGNISDNNDTASTKIWSRQPACFNTWTKLT